MPMIDWDNRISVATYNMMEQLNKNLFGGNKVTVSIKIAIDDYGFAPVREHPQDAGLDLKTPIGFVLEPNTSVVINTKVHIQLPPGLAGILVSKSGLNVKHNITSTGLIDSGYTGAIHVKLYNHGKEAYEFHAGDKISQLVITEVYTPELQLVKLADLEGERGTAGFGSTGR